MLGSYGRLGEGRMGRYVELFSGDFFSREQTKRFYYATLLIKRRSIPK